MKTRATEDRRTKNIKVDVDKRVKPRRQEDLKNISSYYIMISILFALLTTILVISYIWG